MTLHTGPTRDDAPAVAAARGIKGEGTTDSRHSAHTAGDCKAFASLAAEAALARCALHRLADGRYLLTRTGWGLCRELASLQDVAKLLRTMRGAA